MNMPFSGIRGRLAGVLTVLALFLTAGEGKAAGLLTDFGSVSSGTGQIDISGNLGLGAFTAADGYDFTLTDPATIEGQFNIDGAANLLTIELRYFGVGDVIVSGHAFNFIGIIDGVFHAVPFSFQLTDAQPGFYRLVVAATSSVSRPDGFLFTYGGQLNFSAAPVATTPIPPAILMFATALGGLGVFRWRRRA